MIKSLFSALLLLIFSAASGFAEPFAYITNYTGSSVSVIDTATNTVVDTISPVGGPWGVAVSPDGTRVYTANYDVGTVSVIDTATNTIIATITVGNSPYCLAVTPDGERVYVDNYGDEHRDRYDTGRDPSLWTCDNA